MNRKVISFLLALAMLLTASLACAEAVPSAKVPTAVVSVALKGSGDVAIAEDFAIAEAANSETAAKLLEEIAEYVKEGSVANYFGEEPMAAAAEYLPAGIDVATMQLDEFFSVEVANYDVAYGEIVATFEFATVYEDDAVLLAMVGIVTEDSIEWTPLQTAVNEGKVEVTLTQEILEAMMNGEAVLALLRAE